MEKIFEIGMLYDFYGKLLTPKQRNLMELYYENNLTLSEIAENMHISRQAVHDTLKKVEIMMHDYEAALGLIEKFESNQKIIGELDEKLAGLILIEKTSPEAKDIILEIKSEMAKINN
ncbi:MAG: YlxM family DNA-binding protein [Eubacteriales bacterium]